MDLAEMKQKARALSGAERAELRAYLRLLDIEESEAEQAKIFAKLNQARAGNVISEAELRRRLGDRPAA
jgi:hypothetical protein